MKIAQKIKLFLTGGKRRWILLGGLVLAAGCFLIPGPSPAQAAWYDYLNPTVLGSAIIAGILKLALMLSKALLDVAIWLLNISLSNPWHISYTRPGPAAPDNFLIEIGWTLLRDLVNMGFILGLAYIGLSTALDFGNKFNTTKTFFKLILIALLINFTPAICGAVVDIGNILGSFFIQGTDFSTIKDILNRLESKVMANWTDIITSGTALLNAVAVIAFRFLSAVILGTYAVLFFVRGPIIWVLVILSPVAFFAFIFDKTKKQFDKWWGKFIQWALMMPVVLGFFLYLAMQALVRSNEIISIPGNEATGFINQLAPYAVPVGLLTIGLFLGTTVLIPNGGAAVLGLATGAGAAAIGAAGTGVKMASSAAGKGIGAAGSGVKAIGSGIDAAGNAAMNIPYIGGAVGGGLKTIGGTVKIAGSATKLAGRAVTRAGKDVGDTVKDTGKVAKRAAEGSMKTLGMGKGSTQTQTGLESAIEALKGASAATQQAAMNNALPGVEGRLERIAGTIAAVKDGNGLENLGPSDRKGVIQDTIKLAPEQMSAIKNIDPELTAQIINKMNPSEQHQKQMSVSMTKEEIAKFSGYKHTDKDGGEKKLLPLAAKLMAEVKPNQMNGWTNDIAAKAASSGIANQFWNGSQISKAAEQFGSKFVDIFRKNIKSESYYTQNNKTMGGFINSSAAQALDLKFKEKEKIGTLKALPAQDSELQLKTKLASITNELSKAQKIPNDPEIANLLKEQLKVSKQILELQKRQAYSRIPKKNKEDTMENNNPTANSSIPIIIEQQTPPAIAPQKPDSDIDLKKAA